ncbi:HAAAP family serine/threonine permease [Neoactinobaculum massilliense]|uniref:HAAAP family serine/threonine permease n=1 Tax=Neoactinobaculum massilliense TaxID=2364794 RepID=UPI001F14E8F9|nr:HAAAP family serine/threonine permease [Neoactinobaculum massilliense]
MSEKVDSPVASPATAPAPPQAEIKNILTGATKRVPNAVAANPLAWHKGDTIWMLSLFGTAIGAGTLFLPINAGVGGIIPLIVMAIIAFPMAYFAHRGLTRFVLSGTSASDDITVVAEEQFGRRAGNWITVLYFLSVYPILLVYAVSITNTVQSFLVNQLHVGAPPRWLLSLLLVTGLIAIVSFGEAVITRVMSTLVFPFIAVLVALGLFLVPFWNTSLFHTFSLSSVAKTTGQGLGATLWLLMPVIVFAFNHSPIISSFAVDNRKTYGIFAERKTSRILAYAELLMVVVVMFFVLSCSLALSPADLMEAKHQNVTILTYLATRFNQPVIEWVGPIVAMIAVTKSFLGHYLGASEGFEGMVVRIGKNHQRALTATWLHRFTAVFMLLTAWLVSWANPSILDMIETMCGPIIALLLFILPMYAIKKVPAMAKYRGHISNLFVVITGLIAVTAIFYNIYLMFA